MQSGIWKEEKRWNIAASHSCHDSLCDVNALRYREFTHAFSKKNNFQLKLSCNFHSINVFISHCERQRTECSEFFSVTSFIIHFLSLLLLPYFFLSSMKCNCCIILNIWLFTYLSQYTKKNIHKNYIKFHSMKLTEKTNHSLRMMISWVRVWTKVQQRHQQQQRQPHQASHQQHKNSLMNLKSKQVLTLSPWPLHSPRHQLTLILIV